MAGQTGIQWTDWSWNPSVGCTRVSPGCQNCYAFQLHDQRHKAYLAGRFSDAPEQYHKPFSEVQLISDRLTLPLRWRKPRRVFVDSMSDLWHTEAESWFLASVWAVMAATPHITYQILTKRPQRMLKLVSDPDRLFADVPDTIFMEAFDAARKRGDVDVSGGTHLHDNRWPLPNVWLGVSVESQEYAWRIDFLAKTPAAVRFLSCEPLLGPLDLYPYVGCGHDDTGAVPDSDLWECTVCGALERHVPDSNGPMHITDFTEHRQRSYRARIEPVSKGRGVDWVIAGGESGKDYRPMDPAWARSLRDQCVDAGVPFFFKQWGGRTPKVGGRLLDGRTWDEFPTVQGAHQS